MGLSVGKQTTFQGRLHAQKQMPTENDSTASLEISCAIMSCQRFFSFLFLFMFSSPLYHFRPQVPCVYIMVWGFYGIFECANECASKHIFLVPFLQLFSVHVFVLPYSHIFAFTLYFISVLQNSVCLLMKDRKDIDLDGRGGREEI